MFLMLPDLPPFLFYCPTKIRFGTGAIDHLPDLIEKNGNRCFVISNADRHEKRGIHSILKEKLHARNLEIRLHNIQGEPDCELVDRLTEDARNFKPSTIVGLGGGAALDTAKAVAGMFPHQGSILSCLESIGEGKQLELPALPLIAVPCTAGTGSEVTKNAVIASKAHRRKASLRSPLLYPETAILDPALSLKLDAEKTWYSAMDAMTHLLEGYLSTKASALSDMMSLEGLRHVSHALPAVLEDPKNISARSSLMYASMLGGIVLSHAGLGAVHAFAGPLGGYTDIPHGVICAKLLPAAIRENLQSALSKPDSGFLYKLATLGRLFGRDEALEGRDALKIPAEWIEIQEKRFGFSGRIQTEAECFKTILPAVQSANGMKTNPQQLDERQLKLVFDSAFSTKD